MELLPAHGPQESTPEILGQAIELLWDYLEGKCLWETLCRFQKSFDDACVEILTGDDSGLNEDSENDTFYQAHFARWDSRFYDNFLSALDTVLIGAVSEMEDVASGWEALVEVVYGDIGDNIVKFFSPIYTIQSNAYTQSQLQRREREAYCSPMFVQTIALLQKDMRIALEGTPIPGLREQYRNEYLFSPEESAQISP